MIKSKQSKRALLAAISRLIGVALGAGAGSMLYKMLGSSAIAMPVAILMAISSFFILWFVEYEREMNDD